MPKAAHKNNTTYFASRKVRKALHLEWKRCQELSLPPPITTIGLARFALHCCLPHNENRPQFQWYFRQLPGIRTPASLRIQKDSSRRRTSASPGKGTPFLASAKEKIRFPGRIWVIENLSLQDKARQKPPEMPLHTGSSAERIQ